MSRFAPSRLYLTAAAVSLGLTAFSVWCALRWWPAGIAAVLFAATSALILWLDTRPAIEIKAQALSIGRREIAWRKIRRVDQTGWVAPLVLYLTLEGGERIQLLYPGDAESSNDLLSLTQQRSTRALINGIPWPRIFGEPDAEPPQTPPEETASHVKVLTDEDEAEVERLYQQLRTAGRFNDQEK
jgi:hypothetical protein